MKRKKTRAEPHHQYIDPRAFEGKTIKRLNAEAVNLIRFEFTDGTKIAIETDAMGHGIVGMVQCRVCAEDEDAA